VLLDFWMATVFSKLTGGLPEEFILKKGMQQQISNVGSIGCGMARLRR
jgi:hypothetical protein